MRIPNTAVAPEAPSGPIAEPATAPEEAPFRLSPPETRPVVRTEVPVPAPAPEPASHHPAGPHGSVFALAAPLPGTRPQVGEHHVHFELLDDDADPASLLAVSPEIARGLREVEEFEKDRRGYSLEGDRGGFFSRLESSRPAGWFYVKWRAGVGSMLKLLRWVDNWAYLISVPFLVLILFGIVVANRGLVHTGAVVVVVANYGRFWTDLLAFFLRPYKDGPLQGLAFLFPPYTFYYMTAHWDRMKPIVRRIATSCIPIVLVVLAYAFIAWVNPATKDVRGVGAKIRAGERELRKEIKSNFREVGTEIQSLGKPKEAASKPEP
ncbi:MAG: hypothetical protein ACHRXM_27430 [Isosphaerales bacterium]